MVVACGGVKGQNYNLYSATNLSINCHRLSCICDTCRQLIEFLLLDSGVLRTNLETYEGEKFYGENLC